jgi:glycosyltransferase involved in cell wall biosynthesis
MPRPVPDSPDMHEAFLASARKHVLMITNHGVHQWEVIPGLPDTGGQNVYVNEFSRALAELGFKVTIANRGGYAHPATGECRRGLAYKDEHQRILYLEDGRQEFVRKEEMRPQIPVLARVLETHLAAKGTGIDLILSHYWDGAQLGVLYNRTCDPQARHVWIPHSLGTVKKRNVPEEQWARLRVDERIATEQGLIAELDGVAATSSTIRSALVEDYGYNSPNLFLPPCVDPNRYHPRRLADEDDIWRFLSLRSGLSPEQVRECKIITEISRTDRTKRKSVLIEAFSQVHERVPDSFLVLSIDDREEELAFELRGLIRDLGIESHTAVVGSIWDRLPNLYAATDVYCTPSVMEGFGMSAQEAAATGVPIVASHLVPFVVEYLLGRDVKEIASDGSLCQTVKVGKGAIVVQADDVRGFANALECLLLNDDLSATMGESAYRTTIPYFTWRRMTSDFLADIGVAHD